MDHSQVIAICSGGMDSTTLLHELDSRGGDVFGLSFYYGQRHEKELTFARYWGEKLCAEWRQVDISFMKEIAGRSALMDRAADLPREHYTHENQKVTVVPNRNMVMLSIAVAWAENLGIGKVCFGAHANDRVIYPDCREEFVQAINRASVLATYHNVAIEAPFARMHKCDIARLGQKLGVDFTRTWSCYLGGDKHCGKCATCQERKESFALASIADPTAYEA